jgi:hypothetical protein
MIRLERTDRILHAARNALLCLDGDDAGFCARLRRSMPELEDTSTSGHLRQFRKQRRRGAANVQPNSTATSQGIPLELIEELSRHMLGYERRIGKSLETSQYWLHELVRGSRIYTPPALPEPTRNPELMARLERIRIAQENQEYARMVGHIVPASTLPGGASAPITEAEEWQQSKRQLTAIVNVLFSMVGVFVAVFWVTDMVTDDLAYRVLWSLLASFIVAAAEIWLYVRYMDRDTMSTSTETGRRRRRDGYASVPAMS